MLTSILKHFGFADYIFNLFFGYLVGRSTQYFWNLFLSNAYNGNVGVGQDSALYPIILVLYIAPLICIFEIRAQALNLSAFILSFIDNSLLIFQRKMYNIIILELYSSYRIVIDLIT